MIHDNVERIREARGVSKTHLGKSVGLSLQGYRHLASGIVPISGERLKVFAQVLCVDVAIFFDDQLTKSVTETIDTKSINSQVTQRKKGA